MHGCVLTWRPPKAHVIPSIKIGCFHSVLLNFLNFLRVCMPLTWPDFMNFFLWIYLRRNISQEIIVIYMKNRVVIRGMARYIRRDVTLPSRLGWLTWPRGWEEGVAAGRLEDKSLSHGIVMAGPRVKVVMSSAPSRSSDNPSSPAADLSRNYVFS